jgi:hypothetical protein
MNYLDKNDILPTGRRTRGKKVDYSKFAENDDEESDE